MPAKLINVVVPVYNEEAILEPNLTRLVAFLDATFPAKYELVIANNGSTDRTLAAALHFCGNHPSARVLHVDARGRGGALKQAWEHSAAEILTYMDVDLSTDISAFPALIEPLATGKFGLATGSRLLPESRIVRGVRRQVISIFYNRLVKAVFHTGFSDAQCGFKAITRPSAQKLLPLVQDTGWFFDTELLVLAEKLGYRIFDLPITWTEDTDSRVKILPTAVADLKGIFRLRRALRKASSFKSQSEPLPTPQSP